MKKPVIIKWTTSRECPLRVLEKFPLSLAFSLAGKIPLKGMENWKDVTDVQGLLLGC